jgi:hypothetical protein
LDPENYKEILPGNDYADVRAIIKRMYKKSSLLLSANDETILKLKTRFKKEI